MNVLSSYVKIELFIATFMMHDSLFNFRSVFFERPCITLPLDCIVCILITYCGRRTTSNEVMIQFRLVAKARNLLLYVRTSHTTMTI
jgi:hypothetical protein